MTPPPWTGPGLSPLQLYLRTERAALALIVRDLNDAAADAQRRLLRIAHKTGLGAVVQRAQLALVRRELVLTQQELWTAIGHDIRVSTPEVGAAAAEAERALEAVLFHAGGRAVPEILLDAQKSYAQRTARAYLARTTNHVPLSTQVFKSKALAQGWVDREINRVLLQGGSWKDLADRVRALINPNTPGGVSYAAKRLGRTELNNAFHAASVAVSQANPYSTGMKWHLSGSHPRTDRCDALAQGHSPGRPAGVYDDDEVPSKPHPQCLCFVASVPMDEEDFLRLVTTTPPSSVAAATRQQRAS